MSDDVESSRTPTTSDDRQPVVAASAAASRRSGARPIVITIALLALVTGGVYGANQWFVGRPVYSVLVRDSRNAGFTLRAHWASYVHPSILVLDLTRADSASALGLLRGTFTAAETLYHAGRRFGHVVLARRGTPVFLLDGTDFTELGVEVAADENPVYLVRTFPEKLHRQDGTAAFGTWSGGLLGVVGQQMEDVNHATQQWVGGNRP